MATTTTNFGWTVPQSTDLVKDGATAIATLGSGIDTSLVDLKGGTTGQYLTKQTNTDLDFAWAGNPASNYSLLNAGGTALTGAATITVSGISGMNKLMVIVDGASSASASSRIGIRVNADTTAGFHEFYGQEVIGYTAYTKAQLLGAKLSQTSWSLGLMATLATSTVTGYCQIDGCNATGIKTMNLAGGGLNISTGDSQYLYAGGGIYKGTSTVSSISVISGTGNFDAGTVYVYGSAV